MGGNPVPANIEITMAFDDNGTAVRTIQNNGVVDSVEAWQWSAQNGVLTLTGNGAPASMNYSINGNVLTFPSEGAVLIRQ